MAVEMRDDSFRSEIATDGVSKRAVLQAWSRGVRRFPQSRKRILRAHDTFHGRDRLPVTKGPGISQALAEKLSDTGALPQRKTMVLSLISLLSDEVPLYHRFAMGKGQNQDKRADIVESYCESVWQEKVGEGGWYEIVGTLTHDAEMAAILMPSRVDPFAPCDFFDSLDEEDYAKLPEHERRGPFESRSKGGKTVRGVREYWTKGGDGKRRQAKKEYWRDASNKPTTDPGKRDAVKTREAFDQEWKARYAGRHPTSWRLVKALDCFPILIRSGDSRRWQTRGLVVRQAYDEAELRRRYRWGKDVEAILPDAEMAPRGFDVDQVACNDGTGRVYLYELFAYVQDEKTGEDVPIVAMCVDGHPTNRIDRSSGERVEKAAFINLRDEWGLEHLEVEYFWGTRITEDDADLVGVPFLDPYSSMLNYTEGLLLNHLAHAWKYAFGKYAVRPDTNIPDAAYIETFTTPEGKTAQRLKSFINDDNADVVTLPGDVAPLTPPPVDAGVRYLTQFMMGILEGDTPSGTVYGGPGASSGHDREVTRRFTETSKGAIRRAAKDVKTFFAEAQIRTVCAMQRHFGFKIPVLGNDANQQLGDARGRFTSVEIDEQWFGANYRIDCAYPRLGSVIETQQEVALYQAGLASFEDVQEKRGKTSALAERVKIAEDQWWLGEDGQLQLKEYVAKRRGDREKAEQAALILSQRWYPVGGPEGTPMAAIDPAAIDAAGRAVASLQPSQMSLGPGGPPGAPPVPGGGVGNLPQAALAGTIGGATSGAMQSQQRMAEIPQGVA